MHTPVRSAALLVGIDDYSAYDASVGNAPGTSDLNGALNDVRAWYAAARALGIAPEHIVVRTSPPMTAADMGMDATGTDFGPATHDAILEGVRLLGRALGRGAIAQGLLTWSGHGGVTSEGAVLCTADTVGVDLTNSLSYARLTKRLDAHLPPDALTVVLDVCHATAITAGLARLLREPRRSLGASPGARGITLPRLRAQDRVFAACQAYQSAYEYHFMGRSHGAFSWAAASALERWGMREVAGIRFVGLTHTDLVRRTAALLESAAFAQLPAYEGPEEDAGVALFWPGDGTFAPGASGPATAHGKELDPESGLGFADTVYQITPIGNGNGTLGYVVVTGPNDVTSNGYTWVKQRQYWVWTSGSAFPSSGWALQVSGHTPPTSITPSQAYVYPSTPFSPGTSNWTVNSGHWFKIRRGGGQNGSWTHVGWLKVKHQNGQPNENHWYELAPSGQSAAAWFSLSSSAPILEFAAEVDLPPNGQIPNASEETESVIQYPS